MLSNAQLIAELEAGTLLVTANRRLSRTLAGEYAVAMQARGLTVWPTPRILSWNGWLQQTWQQTHQGPGVLLSDALCLAMWDEIVAPDTELDISGRLGRSARDAWLIKTEWQIPLDAIARSGSHEAARFCQWARRYERDLDNREWIDPAQLVSLLSGDEPVADRVRLLGFYDPTPAQLGLMARFRRAGCDIAIDVREPLVSRCEPFMAADAEQELLAAANWAKTLLAVEPARRVAVVVPDLRQRQDAAERLFARVLDPGALLPGGDDRHPAFHLSVGRSLSQQALIHDALLGLSLISNGLDSHSLSRFLRSPYFSFAADSAHYARLDARLREQWFDSASVANLTWYCSRDEDLHLLGDALAGIRANAPEARLMAPGRWATVFHDWLSILGWPGPRKLDSLALQTVTHWTGLLGEIGRLELLGSPMTASQALHHVEGLARTAEYQPERPEAPVQILGVLEAAGSQFDAIWITGLDDQGFPAPPRPAPFIPAALQKEHGVSNSSADIVQRLATEQLATLCGSAPEIVLSWPATVDDEPRRPSPLLDQIVISPGADMEQAVHDPLPANEWALTMIGAACEEWHDAQAPSVDTSKPAAGGTRIFQFQSQCPFKANAALRLHAEQLDEPRPGVSPRLRGMLAHAAMDAIWSRLKNRAALAALDTPQRAALIESGLDKAWEANRSQTQFLPAGIAELERRRLAVSIAQMLDLDLQRADFELARHEQREEAVIGGLGLHVQIDRVDRLDDGRALIIDYKTGNVNGNDALGARPDNPQLAVYALANQADVAGVMYGQMSAGGSAYIGFVAEDGLVGGLKEFKGSGMAAEDSNDWPTLLVAWRKRLEKLAGDFAEGDAKVDPTRNACAYCPFAASCRIKQRQTMERSQ